MCPDLVKEFNKYDSDGSKWIKQYTGINAITKKEFTIDVGYERFLGPEIFFHPEVRPPASSPSSEISSSLSAFDSPVLSSPTRTSLSPFQRWSMKSSRTVPSTSDVRSIRYRNAGARLSLRSGGWASPYPSASSLFGRTSCCLEAPPCSETLAAVCRGT